jgi:hypothetical protein
MVLKRSSQDYNPELVASSDPLIACLQDAISKGQTFAQVVDTLRGRRTELAKKLNELEQSACPLRAEIRTEIERLTGLISYLLLKG